MEAARFNRKNRTPSEAMLPSDGRRYRCQWLQDSMTVHSDGNVSCGLDDPHANRSFGNVRSQPVAEIFNNPEIARLQQKLSQGYRCSDCSLYEPIEDPSEMPQARPAMPTTLIVEPTVLCNLRCPNSACIPNNAAGIRTRDKDNLDLEVFDSLLRQVQSGLKYVYFFNYGDPFVHRQAEHMLTALRQACPSVEVVTSTNGIPLSKQDRADRVAAAEIDHITFTISGVRQESYERYHVNGRVDLALKGLENLCQAKKRLGLSRPIIVWRYLLFRWNDSDDELEQALEIAKRLGVDQFSLYLTHIPEASASFRLSPGSPGYERFARYIDAAHGYNCEVPDADGLFHIEDQANLGRAHWSTWRSRMRFSGRDGWIRIGLSTLMVGGETSVAVRTPWRTVNVPLEPDRWREVCLRVPRAYRDEPTIEVTFTTDDYFFPAEQGSADLRCLGFLIRPQADPVPALTILQRWLAHFRDRSVPSGGGPETPALPDGSSFPAIAGGGRFVGFRT